MRTSFLRAAVMILPVVSVGANRACAAGRGPSLEIGPLVLERTLAPGSQLTYEVTIENHDQLQSVSLEADVVDIEEDTLGTYDFVPLGTTPYSLSRWITISPNRFTIPPGGAQQIKVTISVPKGVTGGRYGAVVVTTVPSSSGVVAGALIASTVRFRMASFIELVVAGALPRTQAYAESFTVRLSSEDPELRTWVGDDALVFAAAVKNESNIHIIARGQLSISTADGRTIAQYPLGGGRGAIIPGATVELRSVLTSALPPGKYRARAVIDYGTRRPIVAYTDFIVEEGEVVADEVRGSSPQRFAVVPDEIEMTLRPGSMRSAVLEVVNRGEDDLILTGQVLPLAFDLVGALLPSQDREGGLSWVTVSPEHVRVRPGMSSRVRVIARAPGDASGAYYADVVFSSQGSGLQTESGSSLFVFVGEADAVVARRGAAQLTAVVIDYGTLSVDVLFVNEGNVHLSLSGELFLIRRYPQMEDEDARIAHVREEQIASVALDASQNPVLPGAERLLRFMLPAELEDGEYELAARVDYGGDEPAIARLRFVIEGGVASAYTE